MSQRFRRNFAPVLGALALLTLAIGGWVAAGMNRTHALTEALHAGFVAGGDAAALPLPAEGFVLFRFGGGDGCATLALLPEGATLQPPSGTATTAPRAQADSLLPALASGIDGCNFLDVRAHATRIPYHGHFRVALEARRVSGVTEPVYGQ